MSSPTSLIGTAWPKNTRNCYSAIGRWFLLSLWRRCIGERTRKVGSAPDGRTCYPSTPVRGRAVQLAGMSLISYAQISNAAEARGRPIATADAFIAACARSLDIPLVTNNRRHFEGIEGLTVISARPAR